MGEPDSKERHSKRRKDKIMKDKKEQRFKIRVPRLEPYKRNKKVIQDSENEDLDNDR